MRRKYTMFNLLFIVLFLFASCSTTSDQTGKNEGEDSEENEVFPVTVTINEKEITIENEPEKIIPLSLEVAEIVLELVDVDRIPAATRGIDDPILSTKADVSNDIPHRISAASNIDPEEIISYDTDLLIMTKMYGQEEDAEKILSKLDTPILSFDAIVKVKQFQEAMQVIGDALGKSDKATSMIEEMNTEIEAMQNMIPDEEKPSVLVLSEVGGDLGPFMLGPTNISYDLLHLANVQPAVDDIELDRSAPASIEQIIKMDPDYIILLDFFGNAEEGFVNLMDDPGWNTLDAIKNDRVKMLDARTILNPNIENVAGLRFIIEWVYDIEIE